MAVFKEVAWKWRRFGRLLSIPDAALNVIEKDFSADLEHFKALILYWILKCPYASWRFLIWSLGVSHDEDLKQMADSCRDFAEKITGTCGLTHVGKNMMVGGICIAVLRVGCLHTEASAWWWVCGTHPWNPP